MKGLTSKQYILNTGVLKKSYPCVNLSKTRLISIVSKPILIVVGVVIDVVFVQKMLGPKKCWLKKSMSKKTLDKKLFGSKRVKSKKVVVQKNVVQKMKVQKNFGSR